MYDNNFNFGDTNVETKVKEAITSFIDKEYKNQLALQGKALFL